MLRIPLTEQVNVHFEYFGVTLQGQGGERLTPLCQLGRAPHVAPGPRTGRPLRLGLNDASAKFFSNAGIGWRF